MALANELEISQVNSLGFSKDTEVVVKERSSVRDSLDTHGLDDGNKSKTSSYRANISSTIREGMTASAGEC